MKIFSREERFKDGLSLAIKGVCIAIVGALSETFMVLNVDAIWQLPLVVSFIYLCYSSLKQIYNFFYRIKNFRK